MSIHPIHRAFHRALLAFAGLNGAVAVGAGAYAAHALGASGERAVSLAQTAVQYQFWHVLAIVGAVLLAGRAGRTVAAWGYALAGLAFAVGLVLFCGALYDLALDGPPGFGRVAPFGGSAFILGWILLAFAAIADRS
jgi:uncharacterized membrane protein YgdD (TMEM256/DUF423 family)